MLNQPHFRPARKVQDAVASTHLPPLIYTHLDFYEEYSR